MGYRYILRTDQPVAVTGTDAFHAEKDDCLQAGLTASSYITVDDSGARHQGKNGFVTHIGNDLFGWFQSTGSKSRINFLELLRAGKTDYDLSEAADDLTIVSDDAGQFDILIHALC